MNIQDAIKSGKPFRPKSSNNDTWMNVDDIGRIINDELKINMYLNREDILAEDWILKQEPRKVTLYQYLIEAGDGLVTLTEWSSKTSETRLTNPYFKLLKTFTREIEL